LPRKQWDKTKKDIPIENSQSSPFKTLPPGLLKTEPRAKVQSPTAAFTQPVVANMQSPMIQMKNPKPVQTTEPNKPYYTREEMLKTLEIAKEKVNHKSSDTGNLITSEN
jgi:hypothetical protein